MAFSLYDELRLPCMRCYKHVDPKFFCPTEDIQGQHIQSMNSQWCLECVGKMIRKYPCSECLELLSRNEFDDNEFMKGMERECKNCANGPPKGLRDSDLLFLRKYECWHCSKNMDDTKKYTCAQCQRPTYCSKSCQKKDWITHREKCAQQSEIAKRMGFLKGTGIPKSKSKGKSSRNNSNKNKHKRNSNKPQKKRRK